MSDLQALIKQRDDILAQIKAIEENSEVKINKILEAIKKQRWYFFKNDPKILMDRDTGYLWANLDYLCWIVFKTKYCLLKDRKLLKKKL